MTTISLLSNADLPQTKPSKQIQASFVQRMVAWGRRVLRHESSIDRKFDEMDPDEIVRMTGEW
jgi:hypothetical protein